MKHGKWSRIVLYALFPLALATGAFADSLLIYDGQGQNISYTPNYPANNNTSGVTNAEAISVWVDNTSSFTYSGLADSDAYGTDTALAIAMYANNTGPLAVNGTMSAYASAPNEASAIGIVANNTDSVNNTAAIDARAYSSDAYAAGLLVLNPDAGFVNNTGNIVVLATGLDTADAYGIQAEETFFLANSGTINTTARSLTNASATGIAANGFAFLDNSENISAVALSDVDAVAYGINADTEGYSSYSSLSIVGNTGDVSASASGVHATAIGMKAAYTYFVGNGLGAGSLFGQDFASWGIGSIEAEAVGTESANASGIVAINSYGILNFGDISSTATGDGNTEAYGINAHSAYIIFNGYPPDLIAAQGLSPLSTEITVSAVGDNATAHGIYADTVGSIFNFGMINSNASAEHVGIASGIAAMNINGNTILNYGDITVSAAGDYANATGIGVDQGMGPIHNNATIAATAEADTLGMAFGIAAANLEGDISNNGTITARASGNSAYAYGIIAANHTGTIDNSGFIFARINNVVNPNNAEAYGLFASNNSGDITNNGTIYAVVYADDAAAVGIEVDDDLGDGISNSGNVMNSGIIRALAVGEEYAEASGISVDHNATGDITNTNYISAFAQASYGFSYAYGMEIDDFLIGNISNTDTLEVSAYSVNGTSYARGIEVDVNMTGDITNTGSILIYAEANRTGSYDSGTPAFAYGIEVEEGLTGSISNSGSILAQASANGTWSLAQAVGIYGGYDMVGNITNADTGTITAQASSADGSANAYGIYVESMNGNITNRGSIEAVANADSTAAYGIYAIDIIGDIDNFGSINASASSETTRAYGINIDTMNGSIRNSGDIFVSAHSDSSEVAYGIQADTMNGDIINDGTIVVSTGGNGVGIQASNDVESNDPSTTVTNNGIIDIDADQGAGIQIRQGSWNVANSGFIYTGLGNSVRTLTVGHSDAYARLVDDFRIIFNGDPDLDPGDDGAYIPQILVGEDGYLNLNDQTLIAQAGENIVWNTPYQVIENEGEVVDDSTFGDLVSPNPNIIASWYTDERGEDSEVIFNYKPQGSAAAGGMRLANLGVIQNSNLIQQRTFSQLLARHIKEQSTLLADSGQTASDAGFLVAKSGEFMENALFVRPYAKSIDRDENDGFGYDGNLYGMILGYERNLSSELTIGAHGGFGMGTIDFTGDGYDENEEDQTIYSLGLHASYNPDVWHFDGSATFYMAEHDYDGLTGALLEQNEEDDYTSQGLEAETIGGYVFSSGKWAAMPYAGLGYSWINAESHTTDADDPDWDTKISSVDEHIVRSILGAQLSGNLASGDVSIVPTLGVRWQYALTDNDISVSQSMLGSPSYEVDEDISRSSIIGDASIAFSKGPGSLELGGMGEYNSDYTSYGGWLALKYAF